MGTADALEVIDLLARGGTRVIVISGGEPTLMSDLPLLLNAIKAKGIRSVLSTNGLLLEKRMAQILPAVDWLALPIDSADHVLNGQLRTSDSGYAAYIVNLMQKVRERYPGVRIKLGTVVTRMNKDSVVSIPGMLEEKGLPDIWKLYQFSPTNYGKDNQSFLAVTDEDFASVVLDAQQASRKRRIPLAVYRNADRCGKYFFVDPAGQVMVICDGDELAIGNIITEPDVVAKTWPRYIDEPRLQANIFETYPLL